MSKALAAASPQIGGSIRQSVEEFLRSAGVTNVGEALERVLARVQNSLDAALTEVLPAVDGAQSGSILDGRYTLEYADGRPHRTLRIETPEHGSLAGKTILGYLAGPDNSNDYVSFAFIDVERRRISMWRRFSANSDLLEAGQILLADVRKAGLAYALRSNNCYRCNRPLTVPASVHRGLGPTCAQYAVD